MLINGTGRTDFQNGNAIDSYNSIFNKLLKLPDETLLYMTIKVKNLFPRLQVDSKDQYIEIMNNLGLKKPDQLEANVSRNIKLGLN